MRKKSFKALICCVASATVLTFGCTDAVFASSGTEIAEVSQQTSKTLSPDEEIKTVSAKAFILTEMQTGTVLFEKNADESIFPSHFTKLMTLLLLSEKIRLGKISKQDIFTVSERANSCTDPQIWLDKGEKISVDELLKAITVGNANDAATVIAENVSGSEEKFVKAMNEKAKALGMSNTTFKDASGTDKTAVTTPRDLSKLCAKLSRYEFLTPYLKTWIVNVRESKAELVNSNRLVRNYPGITGMKACSSAENGSCSCVTADKAGMKLCAVVIGCADAESRDSDVRKLLKCGAAQFQLYRPEIPKELLEDIGVTGGEKLECGLEAERSPLVVIKRGTAAQLEKKSSREERLEAPVKKGQKCGEYVLRCDDKTACTVDITAKEDIPRMNWLCGVKKLLYNLIKL